MSDYDKTIQILNSRLGNAVKLNEPKSEKFGFMGFSRSDFMDKIRPYSVQIGTFIAIMFLLIVFKPNFVTMTRMEDGIIERKLCFHKVLIWSVIAVIICSLLVQLYKYKMTKATNMFYQY